MAAAGRAARSHSRLSLRHLAWNGTGLGIALQAEHDAPATKATALVLAVLEDDHLATVSGPDLAGYGGAIGAYGDGFAIGCLRQAWPLCTGRLVSDAA